MSKAAPYDPFAAPDATLPREPPTLDGEATVRVRVVSAASGAPLEGVTVGISRSADVLPPPGELAQTDKEGIALLSAIPAGVFAVCARGAGHSLAWEDNVGVVAGGTLSVELRLPLGFTLLGSVRYSDGTPAVGARVQAQEKNNPTRKLVDLVAVTHDTGYFRLEGLAAMPDERDSIWVSAITAQGEGFHRKVRVPQGGGIRRLEMNLAPFTRVTATPRASYVGRPGIKLSISVNTVRLTQQPDGSFQGGVESGLRYVTVKAIRDSGELILGTRKIELKPGEHPRMVLGLQEFPHLENEMQERSTLPPEPAHFEVAGHVLLPDGRPVTQLHVAVEAPGPEAKNEASRTFTHFRFEGSAFVVKPRSGQRRIYAWLPDGRAGSIELSGRPGQRVVANITLTETGAVAGRLAPVEGRAFPAPIEIDGQRSGAWQLTEKDGSFFVPGLEPGEHVLGRREHGGIPFRVRARERTMIGLVPAPKP